MTINLEMIQPFVQANPSLSIGLAALALMAISWFTKELI